MGMIEWIVDKWLTWRTGLNKQDRDWYTWQGGHIIQRSTTIEDMFIHFKYIVPVSTRIFDLDEPFGWSPCEDFRQYMYPSRTLGDNTVYYFARGYRDQWDGCFHINDIRAEQDQVFVATNNDRDAVMIALKYSS